MIDFEQRIFIFFDVIKSNMFIFLVALLTLIIIASTIDYFFGWVNARFNPNVNFESGIALYGIIKKMMYFIVLILFMFIAFLIIPESIANSSLTILYIGYLASEVNSILSHLELTEDGKKGEMFRTFLKRIVKGESHEN